MVPRNSSCTHILCSFRCRPTQDTLPVLHLAHKARDVVPGTQLARRNRMWTRILTHKTRDTHRPAVVAAPSITALPQNTRSVLSLAEQPTRCKKSSFFPVAFKVRNPAAFQKKNPEEKQDNHRVNWTARVLFLFLAVHDTVKTCQVNV